MTPSIQFHASLTSCSLTLIFVQAHFTSLTGQCVRMWDNDPLIIMIELTVMTMMKTVMVTMTMKSGLRSLRTGAAMCAHGKGRDEGPWRWRWRCCDDDDDDFLMIDDELFNFMLLGWCWTMIVIGGTKLLKLTRKSSCDENCDDPRKRRAKTWAIHLLVSWNQAQFSDQLMALFSADPGPWT